MKILFSRISFVTEKNIDRIILKKQIYYNPWPFMVVDNFLEKKEILSRKREILSHNNYDDKVMTNRKELIGSENFQYLTKKSKAVKKLIIKLIMKNFIKK